MRTLLKSSEKKLKLEDAEKQQKWEQTKEV